MVKDVPTTTGGPTKIIAIEAAKIALHTAAIVAGMGLTGLQSPGMPEVGGAFLSSSLVPATLTTALNQRGIKPDFHGMFTFKSKHIGNTDSRLSVATAFKNMYPGLFHRDLTAFSRLLHTYLDNTDNHRTMTAGAAGGAAGAAGGAGGAAGGAAGRAFVDV